MPKTTPKPKTTKKPLAATQPNLPENIMAAIHSGQVTMRPKVYFIAGSLILTIGFALAAISTLIFIMAVSFHLRTANPASFLRYGSLGSRAFLLMFPWQAFVLAIISIIAGLWLIKRYDIAYKKSFAGISLAFVGAAITVAIIMDQMGVAHQFQRIRPFHIVYQPKFIRHNVVVGEVIGIGPNQLYLRDPRTNRQITIQFTNQTLLPDGADFALGDHVGAIGHFQGDIFIADGIHEGGLRWKAKEFIVATDSGHPIFLKQILIR